MVRVDSARPHKLRDARTELLAPIGREGISESGPSQGPCFAARNAKQRQGHAGSLRRAFAGRIRIGARAAGLGRQSFESQP